MVRNLLLILFVTLFVALAAGGCSTTPERPARVPGTERHAPGAELWPAEARLLPAYAPIVGVLRLDDVLDGLHGLLEWAIEEPQMFGVHGELYVEAILENWHDLVADMAGQDPLDSALWWAHGLDTSRALYFGFYPASSGANRAFVEAVEGVLTARFGEGDAGDAAAVPRGDAEHDAEHDDGELHGAGAVALLRELVDFAELEELRGLHAEVVRAVEGLRPTTGMRLVVPVADDARLLESVGRLAAAARYEHVTSDPARDLTLRADEHVFFSAESPWPGFLVRIGPEVATIDVVFREFQPRPRPDSDAEAFRHRTISDLLRATREQPAGLPAAPGPPGQPPVALTFHQRETAALARLRGFTHAIEAVRASLAADRDLQFAEMALGTIASARSWEAGAETMPGTALSWAPGCGAPASRDGCLFHLEMNFYGAHGLPALELSAVPGLDVADRSLAASFDFDPLHSPAWQRWLGVDAPHDILGDDHAYIDPVLSVLATPRSVALALANLEGAFAGPEGGASGEGESLLDLLRRIQRVELAHVGVDLRRASLFDRSAAMIVLRSDTTEEERDRVVDTIRDVLAELATTQTYSTTARRSRVAALLAIPFQKEALTALELPGDHPMAGLQYFYQARGEAPYLFLGQGLSAEQVHRELATLARPTAATDEALLVRLEPLALGELIDQWHPNLLAPLDMAILAQRLGPMLLTVRPAAAAGHPTLRYRFELRAPEAL